MSCEHCRELGIPDRLCTENKETLHVSFAENEVLYRRVRNGLEIKNATVVDLQKIFPLNKDSYNRSLLSDKNDVLTDDKGVKYPEESIVEILVSDVSAVVHILEPDRSGVASIVKMEAIHAPFPCNYAHAEIHCFKNDERIDHKKIPKSSKPFMRHQLHLMVLKSMSQDK